MPRPPFQFPDHQSAADVRDQGLRMRVELTEVFANARDTIARSWLLLAEADAILARENCGCWVGQQAQADHQTTRPARPRH